MTKFKATFEIEIDLEGSELFEEKDKIGLASEQAHDVLNGHLCRELEGKLNIMDKATPFPSDDDRKQALAHCDTWIDEARNMLGSLKVEEIK